MLVALREYRRQELQRICGRSADAFVAHYSLLRNGNEVTVADVTDTRARKVVNFDYYAMTSEKLFTEAVGRIARAVLPPVSSPQVVVVVDGTATTRFHTLLDVDDGLMVQLWRLMMGTMEFKHVLEAVHIALVELDDDNQLRDIAAATAKVAGPFKEPVIIEDAGDHFTSVEDALYTRLHTEKDLVTLLTRTRREASSGLHQVFSFILSYKEETRLPNSTIQFVSLAVSEKTRGVFSTRHCISTVTSLIESRSPSITFAGTKISYLLKPVLLGQQPGLWVSCFAPASPLTGSHCETFKEAFAIAYLSSRLYSLRVAVGTSDASQLLGDSHMPQLLNEDYDHVETRPFMRVTTPEVSCLSSCRARRKETGNALLRSLSSSPLTMCRKKIREAPIGVTDSATPNGNSNDNNDNDNCSALPLEDDEDLQEGFLVTPVEQRTGVGDGSKTRSTDFACNVKDMNTDSQWRSSQSAQKRCAVVGKRHPYNCSARYEFETYKRVMEPAMEQLRRDLKHYAKLLEDARRQIRSSKAKKAANDEEIKELRASLLKSERQCELLLAQHSKREKELQGKVTELQALCSELLQKSRVHVAPPVFVSGQKETVVVRESVATQTADSFLCSFELPKSDGEGNSFVRNILSSRVECESKEYTCQRESQWLELVRYHQRELDEYAHRERSLRNYIFLLEEALGNYEAKAELTEQTNDFFSGSVGEQQKEETVAEIDGKFFENLERRCAGAAEGFKTNNNNKKKSVEECLGELQHERRQREASEAELRRLQTAARAQQSESDAAKEILRLVEDSCQSRCARLEREVEELRRLTQAGPLRGGAALADGRVCSLPSTPKQRLAGFRKSSGIVSPFCETQADSVVSSVHPPHLEDSTTAENTRVENSINNES